MSDEREPTPSVSDLMRAEVDRRQQAAKDLLFPPKEQLDTGPDEEPDHAA
jgi:hypothetical protein